MDTKQSTPRYTDWQTIALAIVLMATGLVLVGGDLFGVLSLDRIQNLWPAALIVIGMIDLQCQAGQPRSAGSAVMNEDTHVRQPR